MPISQTLTIVRNFTHAYKKRNPKLVKQGRGKYTDLFNAFFQSLHFIIGSILGGEDRGGDGDTETTIVDGGVLLLLLVIGVIGTGFGAIS